MSPSYTKNSNQYSQRCCEDDATYLVMSLLVQELSPVGLDPRPRLLLGKSLGLSVFAFLHQTCAKEFAFELLQLDLVLGERRKQLVFVLDNDVRWCGRRRGSGTRVGEGR
jgi:hypothetical protein